MAAAYRTMYSQKYVEKRNFDYFKNVAPECIKKLVVNTTLKLVN